MPSVEPTREAGLALLELLVALTLSGLLFGMLHEGFTLGRRVWEGATTRGGARLEAVEAAQGLLRRQLRMAWPAAANGLVPFQGGPAGLDFVAPPPALLGQGIRSRVGLSLARNGDLVMSWLPETERRLAAVPQRAVLLGGVAAMDLGYFGIQDGDDMPRWHPTWRNQARQPRLVRVRLAFPPGDPRAWPELLVAPMIDTDAECQPAPDDLRCVGR